MDNVLTPSEADAPWWLDGHDEVDLVDDRLEPLEAPVMSVALTLLSVQLLPPGAEAVALLATLTGRPMTDEQRLSLVEAWQPQLAWAAGQEQAAIAALAGQQPATLADAEQDFTALELSAALSCTREHAQQRIWQARLLSGPFAATGQLLRAGSLDPYRVWLMLETLTTLPVTLARQVEAELLPSAASKTGSQLRRALRKAARRVDPDWSAREFAKKRTTRRVGFSPEAETGLTLMYAYLPAVEAAAMQQHLHEAARLPSPDPDDPRSVAEREADALMVALLGSAPGDPTSPLAPNVLLQVLVPLATLLGGQDDAGELAGYGDLPAEVVRELAADARWQRWVYEPVTGHLLDQGDSVYVPRARLRSFVQARDRFCQFPGSSRSAIPADLDHIEEFRQGRGGTTSAANLAALSRTPHRAKTHADWRYRRNPDGTLTWTTPLGRRYTTGPYDYRPDSER